LAGVCIQIYTLNGTELENEPFCGRNRNADDCEEEGYVLVDDEEDRVDEIRYV
jgi:hypothetical protein